MKRHFNNILIVAGIIFVSYSCQQMSDEAPEQFEAEVDEVVNIIADNLLKVNILGGDEEMAFSSGRTFGDEESSLNNTARKDDPNPMISCIRNLNLEQNQLQDIRRLLFGFDNCKSDVMNSFREEIRQMMNSLEMKRSELLEQVRSGEISREEFKTKIEELRKRYSLVVEELKDTHKEALRPCLKRFVTGLQLTLGREDWLIFRKCISKA